MEYCICIKPNDKNLMHIVACNDLRKVPFYGTYKIVATASDEIEAFAAAAALVQDYCDEHGSSVDFSRFNSWAREARI